MAKSENERDLLLGSGRKEAREAPNSSITCRIDGYFTSMLLLTVSFFFSFAPFSAIQNLESSLNAQDNLGANALATLYLVYTAGCLLAPAVVRSLSPKYTMIISSIFVCAFVVAHVKPTWFTLLPASASVGLWCAFMWAAQGVYITQCALGYSRTSNGNVDVPTALSLFNGIFWGLYNVNQIMGNVVSSIVLRNGHSQQTLFVLFALFLGMASLASGLLCLLTPIHEINDSQDGESRPKASRKKEKESPSEIDDTASTEDMIMSTFLLIKDPQMLLLTPWFLFTGLAFGFLCSDFSKDLVRESLGIHHIGLVMCTFGGADAVACLFIGKIAPVVGRLNLMIFSYVVYSVIFLFMMVWQVQTSAYFTLYGISILYGVADAVFITQIYNVIGETFQDRMEAAFSLFRMWNSLGMSIAFFGSVSLHWFTKLVGLLIAINLTLLGYYFVDDTVARKGFEKGAIRKCVS